MNIEIIPVTAFQQNCSLIWDENKNAAIIDPGGEADEYWFKSLPQQSEKFGLLFDIAAFEPDRWLDQEGEVLTIGDFAFEVLHLPGHTPGHIGFIEHQKRIAFTGDVLFKSGIGRTDFPGGSYEDIITSIREKLYPLGDDMIIVAGHGPYTTIGEEKQTNPYVNMK